MFHQIGRPLDTCFDATREVGRDRTCGRPGECDQVREPVRSDTEVGDGAPAPFVTKCLAIGPDELHAIEGTNHGIKTSGIDDDVELVQLGRRANASWLDLGDRRLGDVDQRDVVAVVGLVVTGLHRDSLSAETMIGRDQLLGDGQIVDPIPNLLGDERAQLCVRFLVDKDL